MQEKQGDRLGAFSHLFCEMMERGTEKDLDLPSLVEYGMYSKTVKEQAYAWTHHGSRFLYGRVPELREAIARGEKMYRHAVSNWSPQKAIKPSILVKSKPTNACLIVIPMIVSRTPLTCLPFPKPRAASKSSIRPNTRP